MNYKNEILKLLSDNQQDFISGQKIANQLNITRSAVWKSILALKNEGYTILSAKNKGYQMLAFQKLSQVIIRRHLKKDYANKDFYLYDTLDSTNQQAKRFALDHAKDGTIILSEEQSEGRGRLGRSFFSPAKCGLYMSLILKPNNHIETITDITAAAGVAVIETLAEYGLTFQPQIKWVNDIYIHNKKICGILTQGIFDGENGAIEMLILGIGINIKPSDLPGDIKQKAGYLEAFCAEEIDRNLFAAKLITHVLDHYYTFNKHYILDQYKNYSLVLGKEVRFTQNGETIKGVAVDIDEDFSLIIEKENEKVKLKTGEISINLV